MSGRVLWEFPRSFGSVRLVIEDEGAEAHLRVVKRSVLGGDLMLAFRASELATLREQVAYAERLLCGAPDPKAEARRVQEAAGLVRPKKGAGRR